MTTKSEEPVKLLEENYNAFPHDRRNMMIKFVEQVKDAKTSNFSRRFKRASSETTCVLIRETEFEKFNSKKHISENVVSWCVPDLNNPMSESCTVEFCFVVKEVQDFILNKTEGKAENACPMFGAEVMRQYIAEHAKTAAIEITEYMPQEFRSVFEEYDLLSLQNEPLKDDQVTRAVLESIEAYVLKREADKVAKGETTNESMFWSMTKNFLNKFFDPNAPIAIKIVRFILKSPWWINIILRVTQILRIAICLATSITEGPSYAVTILEMMYEQLKKEFSFTNNAVFLVLDAVKDAIKCWLSLGVYGCGDALWNVGRVTSVLARAVYAFLKTSFGKMLGMLGFTWLGTCAPPIIKNGAEIFQQMLKFDQKSTQIVNVARAVREFSPMNFSLLGVVLFLVVMTFLIGPSKTLFTYLMKALKLIRSERVQKAVEYMEGRFEALASKKFFSYLRLFSEVIHRLSEVDTVMQCIYEIYLWITDVIPCLFKSFLRMVKIIVSFGYWGTDADAACCMKDMIMSIRKQMALGEETRLKQITARNAFELSQQEKAEAHRQENVRKMEESKEAMAAQALEDSRPKSFADNVKSYGLWLLGQGPERVTEFKPTEYEYDMQKSLQLEKESKEEIESIVGRQEDYEGYGEADTPTMQVCNPRTSALWVAQCSDATTHRVFPNPIFVYDGKIRFFFHKSCNMPQPNKDCDDEPLCVAPSYEDVEKHYPNATWSIDDAHFVLLHKVPQPMVKHMFHLETPILNL